jgi:[ribosomal protein S5]-alanine N-acetyltransferase
MMELLNDPLTVEFTENPAPLTLEQVEAAMATFGERWERREILRFAVEAEDDDGIPRFAGTASLHDATANVAEIGYSTHPAMRGRGVATAAVRLILDWGFETQGLDAVG